MFFKTKRSPRKTTRQTLSTEQLEPKAMFNAAPLQAEIGFEDRLSGDYDVNDAVLQVRSSQNVTCNTGFSGGGNYICNADSIWTNGGASTLRVGTNSGPGGSTFMTGEDGVSIIHPSYHDGEDGVSIIHPSYHDGEGCRGIIDPEDNIGSTAGPGGSTYLRSDNRFVLETPKDDSGISLHASANPHAGPEGFMKLGDIKGEFQLTQPLARSAGSGGSTPLRSENRFVFEAPKNDGLLVPAGYDFASFGLEANERVGGVGKGTFTTGAGGDSIVHPQYNVGGSASPGSDNIFMPMPEPDISILVGGKGSGYAEAVGLDSSTLDTSSNVQLPAENVSLYDHVQTPRSQAFARMGR